MSRATKRYIRPHNVSPHIACHHSTVTACPITYNSSHPNNVSRSSRANTSRSSLSMCRTPPHMPHTPSLSMNHLSPDNTRFTNNTVHPKSSGIECLKQEGFLFWNILCHPEVTSEAPFRSGSQKEHFTWHPSSFFLLHQLDLSLNKSTYQGRICCSLVFAYINVKFNYYDFKHSLRVVLIDSLRCMFFVCMIKEGRRQKGPVLVTIDWYTHIRKSVPYGKLSFAEKVLF